MVDIVLSTTDMVKPKRRARRSENTGRELRAKVFRTGRSQAVRLPKEVRFEDQSELRVRREGNRVILEPIDGWPEAFLAALGSCPDFPESPRRIPLRGAKDRFGH